MKILQEVEAHRITHAIYVPAVLQFLQIVPNAHDHDLSSMQLVAYGASPITEQVLRDAMAQFSTAKFVQVYGLTETTGAVVQLDAADHDPENRPELLRSAGKPYPWIELRVVGADGEDVAPGDIGEIWIKGVQVMVGYWNNPEETARAITADGWFRSGDAGYLDEQGYLFLHDRVKDMIVSGGENVYPAEVENAVMGCPGVADVAVIGVPDEKWGEAVKAIVVKQADADVTPEQVIAWTTRAHRRVQGAQERRLRGRAPPQPVRQDPEEGPPRALLGRPRAPDQLSRRTSRLGYASGRVGGEGCGEQVRWRQAAGTSAVHSWP